MKLFLFFLGKKRETFTKAVVYKREIYIVSVKRYVPLETAIKDLNSKMAAT